MQLTNKNKQTSAGLPEGAGHHGGVLPGELPAVRGGEMMMIIMINTDNNDNNVIYIYIYIYTHTYMHT